MPYTKKYVGTYEDYDKLRGERRCFFCHNDMWKAILEETYGIMSVSGFIKQAVMEKLIKENPQKKEYYKEIFTK